MSKKLLIASLGLIGLLVAQNAFAAIAFDASSTWTSGSSVTSITISHTIGAGANEMLFVLAFSTNNGVSTTYNGIPMTMEAQQIGSDGRYLTLFALPAPTSGTHNIIISATGTEALLRGGGISYSGVSQSTLLDATSSSATSSAVNSFTTSLTTTQSGDWGILGARLTGGTATSISSTAPFSFRIEDGGGFVGAGDNNAAFGTVGAQSMTVNANTTSTTGAFYTVMAAFAPFTSSNPTSTPDVTSTILNISGAFNVKGALTIN